MENDKGGRYKGREYPVFFIFGPRSHQVLQIESSPGNGQYTGASIAL